MIASMVATLKRGDKFSFERTLEQLHQRLEIETGQLCGDRLPITIEAEDTVELESLTKWVQDLSGILHVDIVFASFESSLAGE